MYENLKSYLQEHSKADLIAVSKTKSEEAISKLYKQGQRKFGENRVQELVAKHEALPKDIEWHMIGALQSNKVKYIAPFIAMIHSVDSFKLAKVIDKEAKRQGRLIKVLLQIKVAQEQTKSGYDFNKLEEEITSLKELANIVLCGVMGMGTFTHDEEVTCLEFRELKSYFDLLKKQHFSESKSFCELSMGMSGDYKIAIKEGSTMVRIGSLLFGARG